MSSKDGFQRAIEELRMIREEDEREFPYGKAPLDGLHPQDIYKFLCLIGQAQGDIHNAIFLFETFSNTKNEMLIHVLSSFNQSLLHLLSELRKR